MASQALSTRHWGPHSGAQEKGTPSFESSIFHFHDVKSEHEHGYICTSEDDLVKLLNLPECTQTWTRFDKSENLSHHVILGSVVGECCCANHDR